MFLRRPLNEDDIQSGRIATAALAHRGPDGQGEWIDAKKGVYLGHRRLSIIDLSHDSDQPMVRGGAALAMNGELYNFRDLRDELSRAGVVFTSKGDAEVFLHGFQAWGSGLLDRADGMFALAYWDGERALLAVDAFGEKPLFVAQAADGVYLCSEIEPLAGLLGITPDLDAEGWTAYLSQGFLGQPRTFYPGIEAMLPGSLRMVSEGRLGPLSRYWVPPEPVTHRGAPRPIPEQGLDQLAEALVASLSDRLISDVPLGLFLSAGVDSSLVAALARRELGRDLDCITVAFHDKEMSDESEAAARIAEYFSLPHQILGCDTLADPDSLPRLLGQPSGTVGALSLEQISARARASGYKVALTGMGGDEVTAGYGKHAMLWRMRRVYRIPDGVRRHAFGAAGRFSRRMEKLANLIAADDSEIYLALKNYPALDWLRGLPGFAEWVHREFPPMGLPPEIWIPRYELTRVMPAVHLHVADRVSMRHSLELRTPFLNRRVVELVAKWDARTLVAFGQKSILRRLLRRYLPDSLSNRAKTGFSYPRKRLLQSQQPPNLPGLEAAFLEYCWRLRMEGEGWASIAVRMQSAARFFALLPLVGAEAMPPRSSARSMP